MKTTYHRDQTITYWSVYRQTWERRSHSVPDHELAAMSSPERDRVKRHLGIDVRPGRTYHSSLLGRVTIPE